MTERLIIAEVYCADSRLESLVFPQTWVLFITHIRTTHKNCIKAVMKHLAHVNRLRAQS